MRNFPISLVSSLVLALTANAASATTVTYTPGANSLVAPFGGTETVIQDFSAFSSGTPLAPGNVVLSNSVDNVGTKPTVSYSGNFLAVGGIDSGIPGFSGGVYTVSFAKPVPLVSFVLGTLDSYNTVILTYVGGTTSVYTGNAIIGGGTFTKDGRVTFDAGNGPLFSSITFSSTKPALEIASIATAAPEPAAWGMMILGFGIVGGVLRSRRRQGSLSAA